jgi:uncharacterized protein YjiS (DUF1127 family)
MLKQTIQGSALTLSLIAGEHVSGRQRRASTLAIGWLHNLQVWMRRSGQRKALRELADLNDYLLKDIGLSRNEALQEAATPFWRPWRSKQRP